MGRTGKQNWKTNLGEIQREIRTLSSSMESKQGAWQEGNRKEDKQTDPNKIYSEKKPGEKKNVSRMSDISKSKNQFYIPLIYKHLKKRSIAVAL